MPDGELSLLDHRARLATYGHHGAWAPWRLGTSSFIHLAKCKDQHWVRIFAFKRQAVIGLKGIGDQGLGIWYQALGHRGAWILPHLHI
jgi:hypothetical protein